MGWLLLTISAVLLVAVCRAWGDRLGESPAERFWVGVAAAALQLGTLAVGLSLLRALTPLAWLGAQLALLAASLLATRRSTPAARAKRGTVLGDALATNVTRLASVAILVIVVVAAAEQLALPVREFDDRMYHGSRAAYWLQHRSVFPWTTHNERQVSLPFGGELWFFWPLLFTRSEAAGQAGFGVVLVLCARGVWLALSEAGAGRTAAALGAVVFCYTPMVQYHTRGLRPEPWAALYAVGCAYWALRATRDETGRVAPFVLAGIFFALAVNAKATALPMALGLIVLPLLAPRRRGAAFVGVVAGAVGGLLLSGFIVVAAHNWREHGHPLGSRPFRQVHQADLSRTQVRTHAARFVMTLLDPPVVPQRVRPALQSLGDRLAAALGADTPLPYEDRPWPGRYAYRVEPFAGDYSLAGLVWAPLLLVALVGVAWDVARTWPKVRLTSASLLSLFAAPMLMAPVLALRWTAGVDRFWLPAYALGLLVFVPMLDRFAARRRWAAVACVIAVVAMVAPAAYAHFDRSRTLLTREFSPVGLDEPFFEPLAHIEDGSTTLLAGEPAARDYPLFAPRRGFANRVIPWGNDPFDPARMRQLIDRHGVNYVLVQRDVDRDFFDRPPRDVRPMVDWLARRSGEFREVPLPYTPGVWLFARITANGPAATRPIK